MAPSLLLRKFFPSSRNGSPSSNSSSSQQSNTNSQESPPFKPFYPEILNSSPSNCDVTAGVLQTTDLDDPCLDQGNPHAIEAPQYSRNTAQSSTFSSKSGTSSSSNAANSAISKRKRTFLPNFKDKRHSNDNPSNSNQLAPKTQGSNSCKGGQDQATISPNRNFQKLPREPKIGDVVYFGELKGIIRYIGNTHFAPANAVFCGLELYTASGKNDGAVEGVRYFQCPSKFGLFVAIERVTFKPTKELVSPKKGNLKQPKLSEPNMCQPSFSEIKVKTSSLRDTYDQNDNPFLSNDCSRSFSNANLNAGNQSAISVLKSSKAAPKTPPNATRKFFNTQQFLRSQSVPKLTTAETAATQSSNIPCRSRPDVVKHQNSQFELQRGNIPNRSVSPGKTQIPQFEEATSQQATNIPTRLERLLRPKTAKGTISKLALGDSNQSKRHSLSESQNELADINALMRDKMLQGSIPNTPLGDGSPGSALRQAQYLFTCPSPTPDQILADHNDFGIVSEPFVIESDDPIDLTHGQQTVLVTLNSPCDVTSGNEICSRDPQGNYMNKIPSDENSQDKMENFLETIPEAENSMANTLDRLADRQCLDSEGSCIPSRRTSPDGSCDNSLDGFYGNKLMLSKVMNISAVPPRKVMSPLKTGNAGPIILSSDEDHSSEMENEIDRIKNALQRSALTAARGRATGSPELPRSLTSSCAHLCDQDDTFFDDEQTTIDEILLAEANISVTFSSKSEENSGPFVSDFYEQSVEHIRSSPVSDYNDAAELKLVGDQQKITSSEISSDVYNQSTFGVGELDHDDNEDDDDDDDGTQETVPASSSLDGGTNLRTSWKKDDKFSSSFGEWENPTSIETTTNNSFAVVHRNNIPRETFIGSERQRSGVAAESNLTQKCKHGLLQCNNDVGISTTNTNTFSIADSTNVTSDGGSGSIATTFEDEDPYVGIKCSSTNTNSTNNDLCLLTPINRAAPTGPQFSSKEKNSAHLPVSAAAVSSNVINISAPTASAENFPEEGIEDEENDNYVAFCDASSNTRCSEGLKNEKHNCDVSSNSLNNEKSASRKEQCTAAQYIKWNVSQISTVNSFSSSTTNATRYNHHSTYAQHSKQFISSINSVGNLEVQDDSNEIGHRRGGVAVFGEHPKSSPVREDKRSTSEQNRYSNVELPSPSLIFGSPSQELITSADNVNHSSNVAGSNLSNYQLEETDNSSSSNEKNNEILDTDDEILKNDPAIVRPSPRRLPVANSKSTRLKPPRSGITFPTRLLPGSGSVDDSANLENIKMVVTTAAKARNTSENSSSKNSSGMTLKHLSSSAGPPALPSRLTKPAQRSVAGANSNTGKHGSQSVTNGEGRNSSQSNVISAHSTGKTANQVPAADVKQSKLVQPKKLASSNAAHSIQSIPSSRGPKKQTVSSAQHSPQKSKLTSPTKTNSNINRRSPNMDRKNKNIEDKRPSKLTPDRAAPVSHAELSTSLEESFDDFSIFDSEKLSMSNRTLSLSSLSSNKSSDRKISAAALSKKNLKSQEQQTKPPVAANSAVAASVPPKRRPSAPAINRAAGSTIAPEITSPLPSRKKSSQSSSANSNQTKPHKTHQPSKEALLLEEKDLKIFKLNDQVANQNKVIESASEALTHSNKAVDVFAVIVQHLTQSMEVFSIDRLKRQVKSLQLALAESQTVIDTARSEITNLKLFHTAQLSEIHVKHEENLASLKNNLLSQFNERTQDLKRAHEQEIVGLLDQHERELVLLDSSHQADIKEIVSSHEARLHDVDQRHNVAIQNLNDNYTQDITSTQQISSQTIQKLRDQLMRAESENQDFQRKIRELEVYIGQNQGGNQWRKGFFEPEADGRPRTKSVPDTPVSAEWMPQELESLRCVLEMRDEEIHKLRREMNDANALRESLLYKEEEMSGLKLKIESLQASLEFKSEIEKELRTKLDDQGQQLEEEKKQRHKLALENDKLTFKVSHLAENMNSSIAGGERCQSAEPQIRVGRSSSLRATRGRPTSLIGMNQSNSSLNTSSVLSPRDLVSPTRQTSLPRSTPDDIIEEDFTDRSEGSLFTDDGAVKEPRRQKSLAFTVPL